MTLDDVLEENEKSIQDLGESTPVNLAWDTQIYTANQEPEPEPEPICSREGLGVTTMTFEMVGQVEVEAVERVKGPREG